MMRGFASQRAIRGESVLNCSQPVECPSSIGQMLLSGALTGMLRKLQRRVRLSEIKIYIRCCILDQEATWFWHRPIEFRAPIFSSRLKIIEKGIEVKCNVITATLLCCFILIAFGIGNAING